MIPDFGNMNPSQMNSRMDQDMMFGVVLPEIHYENCVPLLHSCVNLLLILKERGQVHRLR